MDKRGAMQLKADNDVICYTKATGYLAALPGADVHKVVRYRTDRGEDYGVVVNMGDMVSIWNAFKEKVERYTLADYIDRLTPCQGKNL